MNRICEASSDYAKKNKKSNFKLSRQMIYLAGNEMRQEKRGKWTACLRE